MTEKLTSLSQQYPVVAVTGPRQSGKTTLVKATFPNLAYASLEDPDVREFARTDPRRFLASLKGGAVLDEVQRVPDLLSYIQTEVDLDDRPGRFVLTGSANLMLLEAVSQTLAGRVAMLTLLPLSLSELQGAAALSLEETLFRGFYPRVHAMGRDPTEWYANYVTTFVERDVRNIMAIGDLDRFQTFLRMCAARSGQLLNLSSLGADAGVTHNTARSWLSLLEACYITRRLPPYFRNLSKRLVRTPKLYFLDPGLLCYLLGIHDPGTLMTHAARGPIFESFVFAELLKAAFNRGRLPRIYFYRDHRGLEVDFLVEDRSGLIPVEVKSGTTIASDFFKSLNEFYCLTQRRGMLVFGGDRDEDRFEAQVIGWRGVMGLADSISW